MIRERIADDIYVFTSRRYAQVTAGAVLTKEGVILIDTLFYPEETQAIKDFLEKRLGLTICYVINTHYHADHSSGTWMFPGARIVGHAHCRELLNTTGRAGLEQMKAQMPEFQKTRIILPDTVFNDGIMNIHIGGKSLRLYHFPGHSLDMIGVMVMNDRILFASDNSMPVPTFFDGRHADLVQSLRTMLALDPTNVVQGHGEVILRGEVENILKDDLAYLENIKKKVETVLAAGQPPEVLDNISIESCGKSRIPLNGLAVDLHRANLRRLYGELQEARPGL
ncbi:MAG: MBL fold metallo-hydrolase [Chloroflexi bacterium]|nr:MBL fold metallo-hydrolase [Chloroflexota bacterium]MBP8058852.1 MBL fold metallo-hydrolase [Chloroflexota bacterium]